ncbi:SDR family NAD(P)-dependent oxidoreductase [Parafilimonas terrae]|uniref:Short chain dehydrogenase n=1 Tax=Parafilimonas terrae TaxID=1465490 RepID=A0A1I5SVB2_9BACT|nr:SDR family NAD(P)-dependent oxidoreductase [Parafilimonas terrae]SFP74715.1 short chain dehydrogenase [Parafilimonas terrae]
MNDLENKVAYITGGSKGIGYGIAETLLKAGMKVAITSRHSDAAKKAAQSLSKDESKVLALQSNVGDAASEAKAVEEVINSSC